MSDPIIKDALKHLRDISNDPAARERARMEEDAERDWISQLEEAEWHGRAAGEAKGKAEFLASLLKNPVTAAMTDEQLAELVHLSIEQVARARASLRG